MLLDIPLWTFISLEKKPGRSKALDSISPPNMPSSDDATALKLKGNAAFASHDWLKAVDYYSQAIEANDQDPSFYCNRAQVSPFVAIKCNLSTNGLDKANIKLESYGYAVADATKAIELDGSYVKVWEVFGERWKAAK